MEITSSQILVYLGIILFVAYAAWVKIKYPTKPTQHQLDLIRRFSIPQAKYEHRQRILLNIENVIWEADIEHINMSKVISSLQKGNIIKKQRKLFMCHASEDKPFVERLIPRLNVVGLHIWYDKYEILVGESIVERINEGLKDAEYLVTILSPRSIHKPWVMREMSSSLMRQLSNKDVTILPVLLESCDIPLLLQDIKYADFTTSFEDGFNELTSAIKNKSA